MKQQIGVGSKYDVDKFRNEKNIQLITEKFDEIGNCMLLSANENGAAGKSDITPEEWFKDKDDSYFEMHLIPKDRNLLKVENYEKFIEEREKLIIEKFKTLL